MWIQGNKVLYSFYKKPIATPYVNLYRSAITASTKRVSLFQEGIRRWSNMAPDLPTGEKC